MRRNALLGFLAVLCTGALVYMLQSSFALTRRDQTLPDSMKQREQGLLERLNQCEQKLHHQRPMDTLAVVNQVHGSQPSSSPESLHYDTMLDKTGKPVIEADNFEEGAAKMLIDVVVDDVSPAAPIRFPKRQAALPKWAERLPLYDPMPKCLSGPTPAYTTRLTRRFHIDIPGPELEKLRKAICVVRYNRQTAFTQAINLFSFRYLPYVLLTDLYGNILATHTFDYLTTLVAPKWVNSTTISGILKRYGEAPAGWVARTVPFLWNVETGHTVQVPFKPLGFLHHDIDFSPITQTFMALHRWVNRDKKSPGYLVLFDDIYEVDLSGKAVWHFNGSKHVPYIASEWTPKDKHPDSDCVDFRVGWCRDHMHGNTVFWDQEEDIIYYNAKHTDSFWKIRKKDQTVLWAVGRYGNMTLLDKKGRKVDKLFKKAHGIEKIGENLFLIFDNVYSEGGNLVSRWLEISVDPEKKIAREHDYWLVPPPRYAHQMGDADRMPNGNTIISVTSTDQLTEATPNGEIAWELTLPAPAHGKGGKWWIYHVERFMLTPLIKLADGKTEVIVKQDNHTFTIQLWNTVRVRYRAKGLVQVFRNAEVLVSQPFTFAINWMTTEMHVTLPLDKLQCGPNEIFIKCTNAEDITGELQITVHYRCT